MNLDNVKLNLETDLVLNIGDPIGKTNAPRVYNKLFSVLGMNAIMLPVQIKKGDLSQFLAACRTLGIRYFSPTMPHKSDIIPLLDEVDEMSRIFNSVNAVYIDQNGISHGVGLDGKGAVTALLDSAVELDGKNAVILGSGSISGVIGIELIKHGVKKLTILNRTMEKLSSIADILADRTEAEIIPMLLNPGNLDQAARDADIFLQCTPLGMAGYPFTHEYLGFIDALPQSATVFEVIINPPETPVISAARQRGLKTVPGMRMLAGQMDVIFDFMFGVKLTMEHKEACIAELNEYLGLEEK
jgi:shikimate dehydrogenase